MAKVKIYMLTQAAFIAGTLLAPGSRITSEDLGTFKDGDGKDQPVRPPSTAIEVDARGAPVSEDDASAYEAMLSAAPIDPGLVSPVSIGAGGIGAPAQAPGGVHLAANQLVQPGAVQPQRRGGGKSAGDASGAGNASAEAAALAAMDAESGKSEDKA